MAAAPLASSGALCLLALALLCTFDMWGAA